MKKMKKVTTLLIAFSLLMSLFPFGVIAGDEETEVVNTYGLKENPIIITEDNGTVLYEAESYPGVGDNWKIVMDKDASGGAVVKVNKSILGGETKVPANDIQYRIYVKATERTKLRIWLRYKISAAGADIAYSQGENTTAFKGLSGGINGVLNEYAWTCFTAWDLMPDKLTSLNIVYRSTGTFMDKIVFTTDMFYVPTGEGEYSGAFTLGKDTTNYDTLSSPVPPFVPIKERPRVLLNSKKLEEVKKNLNHEENKSVYEEVVKYANRPATESELSKTTTAARSIKAKAFMYLLTKEEKYGRGAIDEILKWAELFGSGEALMADVRERGYSLQVFAIVYDWCYDIMTDEDKLKILEHIMYNASYLENGYPVIRAHGRNNGHESEGDIFCALLSAGIAVYEDYPEMYNVAASKYYEQMLSTRNFYHDNLWHGMGQDYDQARLAYESFNLVLMDYGVKPGLISENIKYHVYDWIYITRPDNYKLKTGDGFNLPTGNPMNETSSVFFYIGNHLKDPYIRDRFFRSFAGFGDSDSRIGRVEFLIHNDPSVGRKSEKELPLTRYYGGKSGIMVARTGWDMGAGDYTNDMLVRMNLNELYASGHDHRDSGHFDIYYKGSLALDSGIYTGEKFYDDDGTYVSSVAFGSAHDVNYHKRTIAHNSMLIYDPDEVMLNGANAVANDGGQIYISPTGGSYEKLVNESTIGEILAVDYGEDMYSPSFSYIKGDITKAYSEHKLKEFTRSFVFFNFFDEVYPGALLVYDKVTATNPEFKKTWLLHTEQEPKIDGNVQIADKTNYGDNGRLINETLLPYQDNLSVTKIGGEGHEYEVNGKNYKSVTKKIRADFGQWRVEVSPVAPSETDYFLNVLHVTDASGKIEPLKSELIEAGDYVGAKIKDRIAFFSKDSGRSSKTLSFKLDEEGEFEVLVTDIKEGAWKLYKDGAHIKDLVATTNGGNINFKASSGEYKLVRDLRKFAKKENNLNFESYIKPIGDIEYFRFNSTYYDLEGKFVENGNLYLPLDDISKFANVTYEIKDDKATFSFKNNYAELPLTDENLKIVNGTYYVNSFSSLLEPVYLLKWKKDYNNIYSVTGGNTVAEIYNDGKEGHAIVADVTGDEASLKSQYPPINALDGVNTTYWSTDIKGSWSLYTLDDIYDIESLDILWSVKRGHDFKVETSEDGINFVTVYEGMSSDDFEVKNYQNIKVNPSKAKYVKVTGYGNNSGRPQWFNYYEIKFNGTKSK